MLDIDRYLHSRLHYRQHERHAEHINRAFRDLDDNGTVTLECLVDDSELIEARRKSVRRNQASAGEA